MTGPDGSGTSRARDGDGEAPCRFRPARRSVLRSTAGVLSTAGVSTWGISEATSTATATDHVPERAVYVGSDDGSLYAVDAGTGEAVWRFDDPGDAVSSSPTVVDATVYVGSADGSLYAVDAADGSAAWSVEVDDGENGGIVSSPTVVDGRAFVGTDSGSIVALDRTEGTEAWRVEESVSAVVSSPAVDGETLYVGTEDGDVLALSTADGAERWRASTPEDGVSSSPAVADGTVYVGSLDERAYAFDAVEGEPVWNADLGDIVFSSPAVVDGTVYVGSVGTTTGLHALDAETGDRRWVTDGVPGVVSSPTVVDGVVYAGSLGGSLYAIDAETGDVEWEAEAGDQVNSSPTVSDGTVFVGDTAGTLYGFDVADGEEQWRFDEPSEAVFSSPTVVDLAGEGHGVGSRTTLGTLGHHHTAAGVAFEGGDDSTDSSGSTESDDTAGTDGSDGDGADGSGSGSSEGSADDSGSAGVTGQVPAVGLLGAAGGLTVGALAAYRFLGGRSGDTPSGSGAGSPSGRPPSPNATSSATTTGTTDVAAPGSETGTTDVDAGGPTTVEENAASSTPSSSIPSSSTPSSSTTTAASASTAPTDSTTGSETDQTGRDGTATGETGEDETGEDGTGDRSGDALLAGIGELTSAEAVGSVGPVAVYAVTDDRIDGGDGRVLALPDADPAVADWFESVATDWGSVSHYDGIVTVYGSGTDPYPWLVTDPVQDVPTLADHLAEGTADLTTRLSPVVDAAEAMSQASRYTVRHYYLSPETIRVVGSGSTATGIVDDWGIAAVTDTSDHGTREASPYTAPEQSPDSDDPLWRGKPDTYALGALAYHAATGSPPADRHPAKPSDHADVPSALDRPITRAIDPDPDERYDSIGEFARVLRLAAFD